MRTRTMTLETLQYRSSTGDQERPDMWGVSANATLETGGPWKASDAPSISISQGMAVSLGSLSLHADCTLVQIKQFSANWHTQRVWY